MSDIDNPAPPPKGPEEIDADELQKALSVLGKAAKAAKKVKKEAPEPRALKVMLESGDIPEIYYESTSGKFRMAVGERLVELPEKSVAHELMLRGFSAAKTAKSPLSEVEKVLHNIRTERNFEWVGVLAGWPRGEYEYDGARLLNLRSPEMWVPTKGNNTDTHDYFVNLLGSKQADYLFAWTKLTLQSLVAGRNRLEAGDTPNFRISQALTLVGGVGVGKTVAATILNKAIAGEKATMGNPAQASKGETSFNEDLAEKIVHVLDDEGGQVDYRERRKFGEAIKRSVATQQKRIHGKGKKAITLEPFNRTILLLNDELEDLQLLPPLDGSIGDKFLILKTVGPGFGKNPDPVYERNMEKVIEGIPDFLGWLEDWEIPADIVDKRYGVVSYHHPEIVRAVAELGGERHIIELLKQLTGPGKWEYDGRAMSSSELYSVFTMDRDLGRALQTVARRPETFGKLLAKIRQMFPKFATKIGRGKFTTDRYIYDFSALRAED